MQLLQYFIWLILRLHVCTIYVFVLIAKTLDHLNNKTSCFVIHAIYKGSDIAEKCKLCSFFPY